jgi:hypothetical protein
MVESLSIPTFVRELCVRPGGEFQKKALIVAACRQNVGLE